MNGFNLYRGLENISFMPSSCEKKSPEVRSKDDDILDIIYSLDPLTNMPTGSVNQYLSEKTNEQVRKFIEDNLMLEHNEGSDYPANIRDEVMKLDSEFLAKTCRNRFESKEDYEARVERYFNDIEKDKEFQKNLKAFKDKYAKKGNSD